MNSDNKLDMYMELEIKELFESTESSKNIEDYSSLEIRQISKNVNVILESLFKNNYGSFQLPWEFVNSEVGKKILLIKYTFDDIQQNEVDEEQKFFTTSELAIIKNKTRQSIDYQIRQKNIIPISKAAGIIIIERSQVIKHLSVSYKISLNDSVVLVKKYEEMVNVHKDEKSIRESVEQFRISQGVGVKD